MRRHHDLVPSFRLPVGSKSVKVAVLPRGRLLGGVNGVKTDGGGGQQDVPLLPFSPQMQIKMLFMQTWRCLPPSFRVFERTEESGVTPRCPAGASIPPLCYYGMLRFAWLVAGLYLCPVSVMSPLYLLLSTIKAGYGEMVAPVCVGVEKKRKKGCNKSGRSGGGMEVGGVQTAPRCACHNNTSRWMLCWGSVEAMT